MAKRSILAAVATLGLVNAWAGAAVLPFTENFSSIANWTQNSTATPVVLEATGGPDGSSYVTASLSLAANTTGTATPVAFRGHAALNASSGAFVGDWISSGIKTLSFYVKQDTEQTLFIGARVATSTNFPGVGLTGVAVLPHTWTLLSYTIDPSNPLITPEGGPGTYEAALGAVGNVQVFVVNPAHEGTITVPLSLDQVAIAVPEPTAAGVMGGGALALLAGRRRRKA